MVTSYKLKRHLRLRLQVICLTLKVAEQYFNANEQEDDAAEEFWLESTAHAAAKAYAEQMAYDAEKKGNNAYP